MPSDKDSTDTLAPGTTFGRYTIVRAIGSGGMGDVYEARHIDLNKRVALKTLHPDVARSPEARERFVREGQTATRLRHPNVVDVSDVGVEGAVPFLVMEFLEGEDLAARIDREHAMSFEAIAEVMLPVISAVAAAHEEGIIHRDLKPENIFLSRERHGGVQPKLLDFGISKVTDAASIGRALTGTGSLLGTPFYMSPEQATGAKNVDARSDQYAIGVILYECATGKRPFDADTVYKLLHSIVEGQFEPPHTLRSDLPAAFEAMILRAMHKVPAERFPSVSDVGRALLPFADDGTRAIWARAFGVSGTTAPGAARALSASSGAALPAKTPNPHELRNAVPSTSMMHGETLQRSPLELSAVSPGSRSRAWLWVALSVAIVAVVAGGVTIAVRTPRSTTTSRQIVTTPPPSLPPPAHVAEPTVAPVPPIAAAPQPLPVVPIVATAPDAAMHEAVDNARSGHHATGHRGSRERHGANGAPIVE